MASEKELLQALENAKEFQILLESHEEQIRITQAKCRAYRRISLYLLSAIELNENIAFHAQRARAELEELL